MRAGLLLLLLSPSLYCTTCESQVQVTNPTGASTHGAQVIFSAPNERSHVISEGKTNVDGVFRATLESAVVHLTVLSAGFRRYETDVMIHCDKNETLKLPVRLELGETR
jgi:hypothetical protein